MFSLLNPSVSAQTAFDVIVVGAGGSGLAAACSAADNGARVLVLEKCPQPGGTTGIAVGSFTAAGTSLQRAAGIDDEFASHILDAAKFAEPETEARNNSALRAYFLREAAVTLEWLRGLGVSFVGPHPEPPNRVPRMHNVVPGAKAYVAALQLTLQRAGATILCDARVHSLLRDENRVAGVRASIGDGMHTFLATKGVILAAGDYANSPEIIGEHKGDQFRQIEGINPSATGDGHLLAKQAGAQLTNMDITYGPELRFLPASSRPFQHWLPASGMKARCMAAVARKLPGWIVRSLVKRLLVTWQHPENALFDDGAVLLNARGNRFVDERAWPAREIAVAAQPGKQAYILLDNRLVRRYSAWPHFISTAPDIAYAYVADYQRLRPDVTSAAATLEDAAALRGLDDSAVRQEIDDYNRYVTGVGADRHGRAGDSHPLEQGPAVLLGPVRPYFTTTEGGAEVNERMQVLDTNRRVIRGLYAAGQNGLGGMILWGHGLHIAWAMTSGRLAGRFVMQG